MLNTCGIPPPTEIWVLQHHHDNATLYWDIHRLTTPTVPRFLNGAWHVAPDPLSLYCYPQTSTLCDTLGFILVHTPSILTTTAHPTLLKLQEQQHPLQSNPLPLHIHTPYGTVHITTPHHVHTTPHPAIPASVLIYRDYPCQFNPLLDSPQPSFFAPSQPLITWMPCATATLDQITLDLVL